jgi:DNA-binding CsgD family transcriptional regulator
MKFCGLGFYEIRNDSNAVDVLYLWPHLSRVVDMNRSSALERSDASRARRALALVNTRGWIETADLGFSASLRLEWPGIEPTNLPQHVLDCLKREHAYRGRHIEITMKPQCGYLACQARSIDSLASLTRGEYVVASRFARGLTHKEIARELGVSHHTVRTQLTQVYSKLGVHDKAALAQYMMAHK